MCRHEASVLHLRKARRNVRIVDPVGLDSLVFAGGVLNLDFSWSLVNYRPAPIYQIDMFFLGFFLAHFRGKDKTTTFGIQRK